MTSNHSKPRLPVVRALEEARDRRLGLSDRVLLIYLANHMNGQGECWPSQPALSAECGMTDRQVRRSRDELIAAGLIVYLPGDGRGNRSRYRLAGPLIRDANQPDLFPDSLSQKRETLYTPPKPEGPKGGHNVPLSEPQKADIESTFSPRKGGLVTQIKVDSESAESTKKNPPRLASTSCSAGAERSNGHTVLDPSQPEERQTRGAFTPPDGFEAFYQRYPRKVARRRAERAYADALKRGATDAEILSGLERFQFDADPQYRPHPATWLNDGRWLDAPPERKRNAQDIVRERWNLPTFAVPTEGD